MNSTAKQSVGYESPLWASRLIFVAIALAFINWLVLGPRGIAPFFWTRTAGTVHAAELQYDRGIRTRLLPICSVQMDYSYTVEGQKYLGSSEQGRLFAWDERKA